MGCFSSKFQSGINESFGREAGNGLNIEIVSVNAYPLFSTHRLQAKQGKMSLDDVHTVTCRMPVNRNYGALTNHPIHFSLYDVPTEFDNRYVDWRIVEVNQQHDSGGTNYKGLSSESITHVFTKPGVFMVTALIDHGHKSYYFIVREILVI